MVCSRLGLVRGACRATIHRAISRAGYDWLGGVCCRSVAHDGRVDRFSGRVALSHEKTPRDSGNHGRRSNLNGDRDARDDGRVRSFAVALKPSLGHDDKNRLGKQRIAQRDVAPAIGNHIVEEEMEAMEPPQPFYVECLMDTDDEVRQDGSDNAHRDGGV